MKYESSRGGHAPGYLREAFEEHLEKALSDNPLNQSWSLKEEVVIMGEGEKKRVSLGWLLGQLWNCTDVLPSECCSIIEVPCGSSFAQGVRELRASI